MQGHLTQVLAGNISNISSNLLVGCRNCRISSLAISICKPSLLAAMAAWNINQFWVLYSAIAGCWCNCTAKSVNFVEYFKRQFTLMHTLGLMHQCLLYTGHMDIYQAPQILCSVFPSAPQNSAYIFTLFTLLMGLGVLLEMNKSFPPPSQKGFPLRPLSHIIYTTH